MENESMDVLRKVMLRRSELACELAKVDAFIRDWHLFSGDQPLSGYKLPKKRREPSGMKTEDVAALACSLIEQLGRPVPRAELFEMAKRDGMDLKAANPISLFTTKLWRSQDRVANLKGYGYWLADRPYEPAGYLPT